MEEGTVSVTQQDCKRRRDQNYQRGHNYIDIIGYLFFLINEIDINKPVSTEVSKYLFIILNSNSVLYFLMDYICSLAFLKLYIQYI